MLPRQRLAPPIPPGAGVCSLWLLTHSHNTITAKYGSLDFLVCSVQWTLEEGCREGGREREREREERKRDENFFFSGTGAVTLCAPGVRDCGGPQGTCVVGNNGTSSCVCASGYGGDDCGQTVNICLAKGGCYNGGSCILTPQYFTCNCTPGWKSNTQCLTPAVNACVVDPPPCKNGARCTVPVPVILGGPDLFCNCTPGMSLFLLLLLLLLHFFLSVCYAISSLPPSLPPSLPSSLSSHFLQSSLPSLPPLSFSSSRVHWYILQ